MIMELGRNEEQIMCPECKIANEAKNEQKEVISFDWDIEWFYILLLHLRFNLKSNMNSSFMFNNKKKEDLTFIFANVE